MNQDVKYNLQLKPLRFRPELAESVIFGLKWSLGAMFEDPFRVRDLVVAVREVVDNIVTHADWDRPPAPSLVVSYRSQKGVPQLRVSSTNAVQDVAEAERAVRFIQDHIANQSSTVLWQKLTTQLLDSTDIRTNGGIGLLQVASSPRCRLAVRLDDALFCVTVDVDVAELDTAPFSASRDGA